MRNNTARYNPGYVDLARILISIRKDDEKKDYDDRNKLVYAALAIAAANGLECGIRHDPQESKWPVVFIELPQFGQVSWHVPEHVKEWDNHTNEVKTLRLIAFERACGLQGIEG